MAAQRPGWKEILWEPIYDFVNRRWGRRGLLLLALLVALAVVAPTAWLLVSPLANAPVKAHVWSSIDQPLYWYQRRSTHLGDTLTPVCPLVHLEIVNDGDLPLRVASYALSVQSISGWSPLRALPGQDSVWFAMNRDRATAVRLSFAADGFLDTKLKDPIAPHESVVGWAFFELPEGERLWCTGEKGLRLGLVERSGKETEIEIRRPASPSARPEGGPAGGAFYVFPGKHDLSKLVVASTRTIRGE